MTGFFEKLWEYVKELLVNWRPLLTCTVAMAFSFSAAQSVTSIMAPHMIEEFGWARGDFTAVGALSVFTAAIIPIAGRLADVFGVRRTALIGFVAMPIFFFLLSTQNGDLRYYMVLFVGQAVFCILSTATVLSRVIVQYFQKARGLALAIAASGPALTGTFLTPRLNDFVTANDWHQGYLVAAVAAAVFGLGAIAFMPGERKDAGAPKQRAGRMRDDYPEIVKNPAFWILAVGLFLCNLPQVIGLTQLAFVTQENGATPEQVSVLVSVFFAGTLVGRILCGLLIDHLPAQVVSAVGMGLPAVGLFLLASNIDTYDALLLSIGLIGLAFGAEGDLIAYLVARSFGVRIYSSVYGLLTGVISLSSATGQFFMGQTLNMTGNSVLFMTVTGGAVLVGSVLFLLLRKRTEEQAARPAVAE